MILHEEMEGFNSIASYHTADILSTIQALKDLRHGPVLIEKYYNMPKPNSSTGSNRAWFSIVLDLILHKFYLGDLVGSMLRPAEGSP